MSLLESLYKGPVIPSVRNTVTTKPHLVKIAREEGLLVRQPLAN